MTILRRSPLDLKTPPMTRTLVNSDHLTLANIESSETSKSDLQGYYFGNEVLDDGWNQTFSSSLQSNFQLLSSATMNSILSLENETPTLSEHVTPLSDEGSLNFTLFYDNSFFNKTEEPISFNSADIEFSITFQVIIYIIYNTIFVAALLGNILVCYVVFSSPRMRTVTNYLIANLALGDLFMALLCVPFSYISLLLQYWPFGEVLCHLLAPAQAVCVFVSAYTLVALAGDRYVAILYPLQPRLRRSQAIIVICVVWVIAILTALPIAIYTAMATSKSGHPECTEDWPVGSYKLIYSLTLMVLQYFFPLAVLIFTYTRIAIAVWGKRAPGEAEDARDQRLAKAKRKMIKMMLTVVIVYTVSWLPFNVTVVYADLDSSIWDWKHMNYIYPIIQWLALSHTVCNPIIYCWMNKRFRSGFHSAIANFPLLSRLSLLRQGHRDGAESQLNRMSTYTFQIGGGSHKSLRNSSLISNGRTTTVNFSPSLSTDVQRTSQNGGSGPSARLITNSQMIPIPQSTSSTCSDDCISPTQMTENETMGLIIFTSSSTEAMNLAHGSESTTVVHRAVKSRPRSPTRHDSMLESFM